MIVPEIFYAVQCNRCRIMHDDGDHTYWDDESRAIENATESEWIEKGHNHYCPDCYEIDEETDEIKVYDEYPEHLKVLNRFIDKILLGHSRETIESPDGFTVRFSFYGKKTLSPLEAEFIKGIIGDKFLSFDYYLGRFNQNSHAIKFTK